MIFYIGLFILGLIFGSFASVLIHRLKSGDSGILFGRSHCNKCKNNLGIKDLVPLFSYLFSFGKCRHCSKKISIVYPLLEISTAFLFFLVGYKLVDFNLILLFDKIEIIKLFFFLFVSFITVLIIFYDILFLEIHEGILLVGIIVSSIFVFIQTFFPNFHIIQTLPGYFPLDSNYEKICIFFVFLSIISTLYVIMIKGLKEIWDVILISIVIFIVYLANLKYGQSFFDIAIFNSLSGVLAIFLFFFLQILISRGKWLGGGDLRIAIFMGIILGIKFGLAGLMICYLVGSIIGIIVILFQKLKKDKVNTMIPFGPFLGIGLLVCLFFQDYVEKTIYNYFFI